MPSFPAIYKLGLRFSILGLFIFIFQSDTKKLNEREYMEVFWRVTWPFHKALYDPERRNSIPKKAAILLGASLMFFLP